MHRAMDTRVVCGAINTIVVSRGVETKALLQAKDISVKHKVSHSKVVSRTTVSRAVHEATNTRVVCGDLNNKVV